MIDRGILGFMNNAMKKPASALETFEKIRSDIKWAEAAGRSASTMNRLYKKYFAAEDALKAASWGGF